MAEYYSRVSGRFWIDTKTWGERNQRVALYLLTNKHRTMEGLYYLPLGYLCEDLGLTPRQASDAISFIENEGMVGYDERSQVVFLRKALAHGAPKAPMHVRGALRRLREVRASSHWGEFVVACAKYASELANAIRVEWDDPLESSILNTQYSSSTPLTPQGEPGEQEPSKPSKRKAPDIEAQAIELGFLEWLADHHAVTGKTIPAEGTKTRADRASQYVACCREVPPPALESLKLATRGAHADPHRLGNGYDGAENILRVTKVLNLVDNGRKLMAGRLGSGADKPPTVAQIQAAQARREAA